MHSETRELPATASHDDWLGTFSQKPDLRIERSRGGGWCVVAVTQRARAWIPRNLRPIFQSECGTMLCTTLAGVNALICRAREEGYAAEYVGPHETVRLV